MTPLLPNASASSKKRFDLLLRIERGFVLVHEFNKMIGIIKSFTPPLAGSQLLVSNFMEYTVPLEKRHTSRFVLSAVSFVLNCEKSSAVNVVTVLSFFLSMAGGWFYAFCDAMQLSPHLSFVLLLYTHS